MIASGQKRKTVNYDQIAATYDRRFAGESQSDTAVRLMALAQTLQVGRVLEAGCGTARWLADLRALTTQLFGLDRSAGMLARARQREPRLGLVQGRAVRLPFAEQTFDLVFCVNALHHFDQPQAFIAESRRLLRPGGALIVIGLEPRHPQSDWYVYRYFEGTYETDLARYPSSGAILDWMIAAGFDQVTWQPAEHIYSPKAGQVVLEDPFLDKSATSQLALLTDEAYAAGLHYLQAALAAAEAVGEALVFPVDLHIHILVGRTNGGENR